MTNQKRNVKPGAKPGKTSLPKDAAKALSTNLQKYPDGLDGVRLMDGEAAKFFTTDPYAGQTTQQHQRRVDKMTFTHKAAAFIKRTKWSTGSGLRAHEGSGDNLAPGALVNLCWVAPEVASSESDVRGVFSKLHSSSVKFSNVANCNITIYFNCPKTNRSAPNAILHRDKNQVIQLKPGQTFTVTSGFSEKRANNVAPLVFAKDAQFERSIFNYAAVRDDVNPFDNADYNVDANLMSVSVSTVYSVTMSHPIGAKVVQRSEYALRKIPDVESLSAVMPDPSSGTHGSVLPGRLMSVKGETLRYMPVDQLKLEDGTVITGDTAKKLVVIMDNSQNPSDYVYFAAQSPTPATPTQDVGKIVYVLDRQLPVPGSGCFVCLAVAQITPSGKDPVEFKTPTQVWAMTNWSTSNHTQDLAKVAFTATVAFGSLPPVMLLALQPALRWSWGDLISLLEAAIKVVEIVAAVMA